jgi:hypothetical protein
MSGMTLELYLHYVRYDTGAVFAVVIIPNFRHHHEYLLESLVVLKDGFHTQLVNQQEPLKHFKRCINYFC